MDVCIPGVWCSIFLQLLGDIGMVNTVLESGDLLIRYPNNSVYVFNPEAVTKVSAGMHGGICLLCLSLLPIVSLVHRLLEY